MPRDRGLTLFETLIASGILAFAATAVVQAVTKGHGMTADALHSQRGDELAQAMLEEVLARPVIDPDGDTTFGPENGESNRTKFDAIDDFHGFVEEPGDLQDPSRDDYPETYQRFERSVSVTATTLNLGLPGEAVAGYTVTVTVSQGTGGTGRVWKVMRFVALEEVAE